MSIELGISPNDLMDTPPDVFGAMVDYLDDRRKRFERQARKHRG